MPERSQAATDLDSRLAEIDSTLRAIQAGLAPDRRSPPGPPSSQPEPPELESPPKPEPEPEPPPPPRELLAEPPPRPGPTGRHGPGPTGRHGPLEEVLQAARELQPPSVPEPEPTELLGQIGALTELHRRLLESSHDLLVAYEAVLNELRAPSAGAVEVTVTAGPFMSLDAVRAFEAALATLPGVADVAVRGYERGNRAIVDVQLIQRTS
jgi:hypothetical protein